MSITINLAVSKPRLVAMVDFGFFREGKWLLLAAAAKQIFLF